MSGGWSSGGTVYRRCPVCSATFNDANMLWVPERGPTRGSRCESHNGGCGERISSREWIAVFPVLLSPAESEVVLSVLDSVDSDHLELGLNMTSDNLDNLYSIMGRLRHVVAAGKKDTE